MNLNIFNFFVRKFEFVENIEIIIFSLDSVVEPY